MLKKLMFVSILVLGAMAAAEPAASPAPAQEGRGGNPHADRFKRMGRFLNYHLTNNQVTLSTKLADFEKFQKNVRLVPIEIVKDFPKEIKDKLKQEVVGMTIDDPTSPIKKKILLHEERFTKALDEFDRGKVTTIYVLPDPGLIKTITEKELAATLKQVSFNTFVFHEFLLASGEKDEHMEISTHLYATRDHVDSWTRSLGGLQDVTLSVGFAPFRGPIVEKGTDLKAAKEKALDDFIEAYNKEGKELEKKMIQDLKDSLHGKTPVVKTKLFGETRPSEQILYFANRDSWDLEFPYVHTETLKAGVYFYLDKSVTLYLDTDERILSETLTEKQYLVAGERFDYTEFSYERSKLNYETTNLLDAERKAWESFWKTWPVEKAKLEVRLKKLYGNRLLFITFTRPEREVIEGKLARYSMNLNRTTIGYGPMAVGFRYTAKPIFYYTAER